ncbi:MAG: RecQ family ATP-dependent DNA helicase [Bacteroidetes bacterium]|nr:RecQ family ATP-dependent DNA helicase [Bacteroidota bacterium]
MAKCIETCFCRYTNIEQLVDLSQPEDILKRYWGYDGFRPLQREIIDSVLAGKDVLALLPTGGGKSVCYQIPALIMDGVCLVVSPLIALMQDQVAHLKKKGISAACIHSGMHFMDVKRVLNNAVNDAYKLLYVSPERLQTSLFNEYLLALQVSMVAIDEAHCISQWGHDFRPDYMKIKELREEFDDIPFIALTATATEIVRQDIITQLTFKNPDIYIQSFERSNIFYDVAYSENKNNALMQALAANSTASIVYCRSRKQTEVLTNYLSQHNIPALPYHAGMAKAKRDEHQQLWVNNKVPVIIATTAFGMGIDKADVGLVVNYDAPEHPEAYYQESGRAGRNGKVATSVVLYNHTDINRLNDSIDSKYPDEATLKKVYQSVVEYLQIPVSAEPDQYYPFDLKDFCNKFKLDANITSNALKLLEQEGLWTLTEAVFNPSTLQFTANRQQLDEITYQYPALALPMAVILRLYGSLFVHPTPIQLSSIAKQLKTTKEEVEQILMQLQSLGIAIYTSPKEGPQLYFHHYRVDSRHLLINMNRISELKQRHTERTHAMVDYLYNKDQCRTKLLLHYFGEHKQNDCGHCDVCLSKKDKQPVTASMIQDALMRHKPKTIQELISLFAPHQKDAVLAIVRKLVDEKQLTVSATGAIVY